MPSNDEQVLIKLSDLKVLERLAVEEAKLGILAEDFQRHRDIVQSQLKELTINIGKLYDLSRNFPHQVSECREKMESDIEKIYMTKQDGALLEQHLANNIKSIKLWIVSTVTGCSGAGVFILWLLKLNPLH